MFKVRGLLSSNKAFAYDGAATTLSGAVTEMDEKLKAAGVGEGVTVTRVTFIAPKVTPSNELKLADAPKRAKKAATTTPATTTPRRR
jgi:hypothetical protein